MATLFVVIFIAFIGVGLPDSVLGTAWPAMYREFGLDVSLAGYISICVNIGTITSSLCYSRLVNKLGTGVIVFISTTLTALGLLGFSFTYHPLLLFLFAIPLGLGAGAVDTSLNAFAAVHYSASAISYLHCFYGVGVAVSPFIMSLALGDGNWRRGYFVVALIQGAIALVTFLALPLWKKVAEKDSGAKETASKVIPLKEVLKMPEARANALAFFGSCAVELTAGGWCSTYFVNTKGLESSSAALITMVFYIGMAVGRFLSGVFATKLGSRKILYISITVIVISLAMFLIPAHIAVSGTALFLLGFSIGPVFPNLVHITPKIIEPEALQSVMGMQQTFTCISVMLMPWIFGVLAAKFTTAILPYYLILMFAIYLYAFVRVMKLSENKV